MSAAIIFSYSDLICCCKARKPLPQPSENKLLDLRILLLRTYEDDPPEAMRQLKLLLEDPDVEDGIRVGDVYGFMVEHYAKAQDYNQVTRNHPLSKFFMWSVFSNDNAKTGV